MRRALRALSTVLIAGGILLIADAGLTLVWQEPVSALYARIQQHDLKGRLVELERSGPTHAEKLALERLKSDPRRMAFLARALRRKAGDGDPIGRIRIPKIGASFVVVEGTQPADLREGPGRYADTSLPGLRGTVAIAGHRTTYLAPFRDIDQLVRGSQIVLEMPYGRFTYRVFAKRIVPPGDVAVIDPVRRQRRLVLTACHPLYSAAKRIVVFSELVRSEPRGAALRA
jgi:sortase A